MGGWLGYAFLKFAPVLIFPDIYFLRYMDLDLYVVVASSACNHEWWWWGGGGQSLMCTHATGVGCRDRIPHGLQPLFVGRSDGSSLPIFVLMEKEFLNWSVFPAGTWKCFELLVADLSYRQLLLE